MKFRNLFVAGFVLLCTGCGAPAAQIIKDVSVGLSAADCFFKTYTNNVNSGDPQGEAAAQAAITCGLSEAQGLALLQGHHAAMAAEKKCPQ